MYALSVVSVSEQLILNQCVIKPLNRSSFPRYQMTAVGWKVPLADDRYRPKAARRFRQLSD